MPGPEPRGAAVPCPGCGTDLPRGRLACPACHRLVHAAELTRLAEEAERATREGRASDAVSTWRAALAFLPPESRQSHAIAERLQTLTADGGGSVPGSAASATRSPRPRWARAGALGVLGLLLWKLKFVLVFVLAKAKLLLSGLAKSGTLVSMAASLGVYWTIWGWRFAAGLVLSIYVHEMGHVAALRRLGIPASAPMFIPGFGALVRMKQLPASAREEARVGLAGPVWGLGAALACALVYFASGAPFWAAITQWGARINLFNLVPVRPLDGGRGFAALSRGQVAIAVLAIAASLLWSHEGMLWLLLLVGGARLLGSGAAGPGDRRATVEYVLLVTALTALATLPVALPAR